MVFMWLIAETLLFMTNCGNFHRIIDELSIMINLGRVYPCYAVRVLRMCGFEKIYPAAPPLKFILLDFFFFFFFLYLLVYGKCSFTYCIHLTDAWNRQIY